MDKKDLAPGGCTRQWDPETASYEECGTPSYVPPSVERQPPSAHNTHPAVWDLVMTDIIARDKFGEQKYKTKLQPFNGRDTLKDLYQELMDALVYTRTLLYERDGV